MEYIKVFFSWLLTGFLYLMGGLDIALIAFLIAIVLDYLTGIAKAFYLGKVSSKQGLKGLIKKFEYLVVVALCVVVDKLLGDTGMIRTMILYYFVANEGISILENCAKMNVPIPKWLIDKLEQLKDENDGTKEDTQG